MATRTTRQPAFEPEANPNRVAPALSDLSVTEFLSLSRLGFLPHGLVVGSSFQDAGWVSDSRLSTREVVPLGKAMRDARQLAVERMRRQAEQLGAEGVVGVRLEAEHHEWRGGHHVVRFLAVGTAIGFDAAHAPPELQQAPSLRVKGRAFASDLSGQDFVLLLRAGYRPVGLALGNCVYQIASWASGGAGFGNQELAQHTRAFLDARETAMLNLENDLKAELGGEAIGVVGMRVEERAHPGRESLVEFTAVGTAVAHLAPDDPRRAPELPAPKIVVPLDR